MNTTKPLLLGSALLSLCASAAWGAAYQDVVGADHPVGYWRLGDAFGSPTAMNSGSLGSSANGQIFNNVTLGATGALSGNTDTAITVDGGGKIEVPYKAELNPPVFTVELWAESGPTGDYRSPLCTRATSPQTGYFFYKDPSDTWQFWSGTGYNFSIMGSPPIEPGAWAHLVGIFDGQVKWFYVNGVLAAAEISPFVPNTSRMLRIGAGATESDSGDFWFEGGIDEVAVYNSALTPDRIVAHFTSGAGTAPAKVAPAFAVQPPGPQTNSAGTSATLTALATGTVPLSYQWYKDGTPISGATSFNLTLANLQVSDSGLYTVTVTNLAGSITSTNDTQITVVNADKPVITQQPQPVVVFPGNPASFSVAATGSSSFAYQWKHDAQDIPGATSQSLTIPSVQAADLGTYTVLVTDPAGSTLSDAAMLSYPPAPAKSYAATVKDDAPAGYWRLGDAQDTGMAKDEVSWNDGTCTSVTMGQAGAIAGDADTAAGFDSTRPSKIDVAYNPDLNPTNFTIECWAKVTGGAGSHRSPLTSRDTNPDTGSPAGYIFYAEPGNTWQCWVGTTNSYGWDVIAGPAVHLNSYDHLVATYDGTNLSFYINSVLVGRHQLSGSFDANITNPLRIGGGETETFGNFFFQGSVDEVAVYSTALNQDRILAHYVAGFPMSTPPTVTLQPQSQTVPPGANVTFTVAAAGIQPLSYQWRFNGQNIAGATQTALTLNSISSLSVGQYVAVVTNVGGSVTSSVATLSIPTPSPKAYAQLVKDDGAVGYWRLGETSGTTAKDEIAGYDGQYLNGVTLGAVGAIPKDANAGATFNGAGQKVDVPWSDVINPPVFTAECWAKVTGGEGSHRSPLTSRSSSPQQGFIFYAEPGNTWQFWAGPGWTVIPGPAVHVNAYDHLVGVYDGTTFYFYVNGLLAGQKTASFNPNSGGYPLRIGGGESEDDGNFFFQGSVDEVAIYDKALTSDQVVLHFLAGYVAPVSRTLHYGKNAQGQLVLSWENGTLESTTSLQGTWGTVSGANSPYTVDATGQTARFYRLKVQ